GWLPQFLLRSRCGKLACKRICQRRKGRFASRLAPGGFVKPSVGSGLGGEALPASCARFRNPYAGAHLGKKITMALYPPLDPFHQEYLPVGDGHELYLEQCGNPDGVPVMVLHGGPGG